MVIAKQIFQCGVHKCVSVADYDFPGKSFGTLCKAHKLSGMIQYPAPVLKKAMKEIQFKVNDLYSKALDCFKEKSFKEAKENFKSLFKKEFGAFLLEKEKSIHSAHQRELYLLRERLYNATRRPSRGALKEVSPDLDASRKVNASDHLSYAHSDVSKGMQRTRLKHIKRIIRYKCVGAVKEDGTRLSTEEKNCIMFETVIPDLLSSIKSSGQFEKVLLTILEQGRAVNLIQGEINDCMASFVRSPTKIAHNYASRIGHNLGRKRWNGVEEDLHTVQTSKGKSTREFTILKGKVKIRPARLRSYTKKDKIAREFIHKSFGEGIPEVTMFGCAKRLRHAKMRLHPYMKAVQKTLEDKKSRFCHSFENDLGEKRKDLIIALSIDGCNQGKQIGAGSQGGSKDVTLINCQHLNYITAANYKCFDTYNWGLQLQKKHSQSSKQAMHEISEDKATMEELRSPVIQLMKCDLNFIVAL
jgi:coenzyme F420-reducing hydrogenase delta subunit